MLLTHAIVMLRSRCRFKKACPFMLGTCPPLPSYLLPRVHPLSQDDGAVGAVPESLQRHVTVHHDEAGRTRSLCTVTAVLAAEGDSRPLASS